MAICADAKETVYDGTGVDNPFWVCLTTITRLAITGKCYAISDDEVRHNIYQAGEVIVDRARPVRYVHVLIEGEVDLRRRVDGVEETLQTMGAGNHFGRKKLEQQSADRAVARSVVRTIALRDDQANRLQDVLASAGQIVAKTGIFPTAGSRSE